MQTIGIITITIICIIALVSGLGLFSLSRAFGSTHKSDFVIPVSIIALSLCALYYVYFIYLNIHITIN